MEESSANASAPLLRPRQEEGPTALALLLGRAMGRNGPTVLVRETAARELEERRADWGYSRPVVALDTIWNLACVAVTVVMLLCTVNESPNVPIRVWACGYALQCFIHVVLVWFECRRRNRGRARHEVADASGVGEDDTFLSSVTKRCESMNTMASYLWWIVGFYWVVAGGDILLQNAPHLFWLAVVFLAFDVFFAIFCVVLACLIGIALCCCLPCIIAVLYAFAGQEGASEADLCVLPKYSYQISGPEGIPVDGMGRMIPVETSSGYLTNERIVLPEDAECCICLSPYENGAELRAPPCGHHFHSACIVKWLKMNAICPLCKYNILKGSERV